MKERDERMTTEEGYYTGNGKWYYWNDSTGPRYDPNWLTGTTMKKNEKKSKQDVNVSEVNWDHDDSKYPGSKSKKWDDAEWAEWE